MKNVREVSRDFQAQNNAEWSLSEVVTLISDYARKYDSTRVVIDGATPSLLVESSNRRFGKRSYLEQEYTRDFEILTMPRIKRGEFKFKRGKPIRYDHHDYWHEKFRRVSDSKEEGEGRWDPEDLTRVFAHFRGQWIVCRLTKRLHVPMSRCRQAKSDQLRYEASLNNRARVEANEQMANFVDDSIEAAKVERKAADLPQSISTDSKTSKGSFWSVDIPESRND